MKQRIIIITFSAMFCIAGAAIIRVKTNEPPDSEIDRARKLISEAELVRASRYANEHYLEASMYYDTAMAEWGRENERFILFRDYSRICELAGKSAESSKQAISGAKTNMSKVEAILEIRLAGLGAKIKEFDENFGSFPMNSMDRKEIINSKLTYSESRQAFNNKNYILCKSKLDSVEPAINQAFEFYQEKFNSYMEEAPEWMALVEKTIQFSKRNRVYCIVVDKLARECILYKDGKVLNRYSVELGTNWIGDKNQQGDKSTPEGLYKITLKKAGGQTRFYKALMLDYPNNEDKIRFAQNKASGAIHPDANIGNLIEIHGHGGKGTDWTDGCIALEDSDMDALYSKCQAGTWVTIVGSSQSFRKPTLD